MKLRIKSMIWNIKNTKNNQSEREEKIMQKIEYSVSSLWDYFKGSNTSIIGMAGGEKKEQENENLFEKIMT